MRLIRSPMVIRNGKSSRILPHNAYQRCEKSTASSAMCYGFTKWAQVKAQSQVCWNIGVSTQPHYLLTLYTYLRGEYILYEKAREDLNAYGIISDWRLWPYVYWLFILSISSKQKPQFERIKYSNTMNWKESIWDWFLPPSAVLAFILLVFFPWLWASGGVGGGSMGVFYTCILVFYIL